MLVRSSESGAGSSTKERGRWSRGGTCVIHGQWVALGVCLTPWATRGLAPGVQSAVYRLLCYVLSLRFSPTWSSIGASLLRVSLRPPGGTNGSTSYNSVWQLGGGADCHSRPPLRRGPSCCTCWRPPRIQMAGGRGPGALRRWLSKPQCLPPCPLGPCSQGTRCRWCGRLPEVCSSGHPPGFPRRTSSQRKTQRRKTHTFPSGASRTRGRNP